MPGTWSFLFDSIVFFAVSLLTNFCSLICQTCCITWNIYFALNNRELALLLEYHQFYEGYVKLCLASAHS